MWPKTGSPRKNAGPMAGQAGDSGFPLRYASGVLPLRGGCRKATPLGS